MTQRYYIVIADGTASRDIMALVNSSGVNVTNSLPKRPNAFIAECTEDELSALSASPIVRKIEPMNVSDMCAEEEQAIVSKSVSYIRRQPIGSPPRAGLYNEDVFLSTQSGYDYNTTDGLPPLGNWGLLRHTVTDNNQVANLGRSDTYTAPAYNGTSLDGSGVDIILNIGSILDIQDPEFQTNGTTRIQQFQWRSLPLRYAEDTNDGNSAGDLILDGQGQTQYNISVPTIKYTDTVTQTFNFDNSDVDHVQDTIEITKNAGHTLSVNDILVYYNLGDNEDLGTLESGQAYYVKSVTAFNGGANYRIELKSSQYSTGTKDLGNSAPPTGSHRFVELANASDRVQVAESSTHPDGVTDHAEGVAYIACSNTYGWATGAQIYIWPRNQVGGFASIYEEGWDSFRLFHQNKIANGNTRPTIVIDSVAARFDPTSKYDPVSTGLYFRNNFYNIVAPGGSSEVAIQGFNQLQQSGTASGVMYGNTYSSHYSGSYNFNGAYDGSSLSSDDLDEIATKLNNGVTESSLYESRMKPLEDMISAGVHHVSAAGNYNTNTALPGGIDYNNGQWSNYAYDMDNLGDFFPFMRRNYYCAGDTITCASLASFFTSDRFDGKETMSDFSCRGESVDTCAAGESIYANMFSNGYYAMSGTSFASPNIAGMACLVLQLHPTTTPRQLRRFFRFYAVGEEKLYETGIEPVVGSKFGDPSFFNDLFGNRGYSGNIAFLDPDASNWQNPTQLSNDPITSTMATVDNKLNFTIAEINSKLGSV
jgi:hypothetical protein